jgi:hypothetical protein
MTPAAPYPLAGGCDCRAIRYRLESPPLIVHCCHCRWCQRESGASFALNAMIEADRVTLLCGTLDEPDHVPPDIHIFTSSKQPWVVPPEGARAVPEYYDRRQVWSADSLARREAVLAQPCAKTKRR